MENLKEDYLKCLQNENDVYENNLLLCNKCLSIPKIDINPYNHKIVSLCPNNHQINPISLDLYLKEELNKNIICSLCNQNNNLSNLLYCTNCLSIICNNCINNHNSSHKVIKYLDINFLCFKHQIKNSIICLTCNKEICDKCLESKDHINHKIQSINEYLNMPDNKISSNLKNALNSNFKKEKKQIEIIKDMLVKKINNVTEIKNIENKINTRILNNIDIYPNNYNSIFNLNNMIKNNSESEDNYYETISNITNLLENYLTNGNSGKEKLILMKRQNLKNIFFLIIFLIIIIIASYYFGDFSISKYSNDNDKLIFNDNSNLLKLSEIIISEEQEKQINNYIIKSSFKIIQQYNNIFNKNRKFNISLNYKLIYKGTRDGDNIYSFHKRCDDKNNLLFIFETQRKEKFGLFSFNGYKDAEKNGGSIKDINKFLFKLNKNNENIKFYDNNNDDVILLWKKEILFEIKQKNNQILYIPNNFLNENNYCFGEIKRESFDIPENFELNNEIKKFIIKDIEVFQVIFKNYKI